MKAKSLIVSCLLIVLMCVFGISLPVFADGDATSSDTTATTTETTVKAINLDNSVKAGDVFYFGTYTANNVEYTIPWVAMNDEGYIFSRYTLGKAVFSNDSSKNAFYPDSQLKTVMDGFYNGSNTLFTDSERSVIEKTTLTAESMDMGSSKTTDTDAYVFPLSGWLIYNFSEDSRTYYGDCNTIKTVAAVNKYRSPTDITAPTGDEVPWWTRTKDIKTSVAPRGSDGQASGPYINYVNTAWWAGIPISGRYPSTDGIYVRPALTLDTSSVLFRSAPSGKTLSTIGENSLQKVEAYTGDGTDWKLTFLDSARSGFTANITKSANGKVVLGKYATIEYSGAKTGDNEYISAMILDTDGNLLYYGQVAKSQESGIAQVYLPKDIEAGSYTLRIFNEQLNADYKSDFSSAFVDIAITAYEDTAAPTGKIKIGTDYFDTLDSSTTFCEPVSFFDYYFGDRPKVTITATDDGDYVEIEYFIADKSYTKAELEEVEFLPYTDTFYIDKDIQRAIVYARLADNASHVTYLCTTQSYCVDTTPPSVGGIENGGTYCGMVTVTVSDLNLLNAKLNGAYVKLNNNTFEVSPLDGAQTIIAKDYAGNETTCTITVNDGHTAEADDGDCTTDIKCKFCEEVLTEGHTSHNYIEDTSYTGEEKKYICSRSGCTVSKLAYKINFEDKNITTDKIFAEIGESVKVGYNKGYNATWSIKSSSGEDITYTTDETDKTITFTMPACGVVVSATPTPKQFNVVYNYISDANEPITEKKPVNYGDNFVLSTAATYSYQDYNFEFCCWRVSYTGTEYSLTTIEQPNASSGTDTVFKVDFIDESLTYTIYSHYMAGIEPSLIVAEPCADENPSYDVYEKQHYINIQSTDVSWYIGEYDDSKDFPSNGNDLQSMGQSQTFVEGQKYTVCIWVSLHNEYFSVKKSTEGGSLGYVNPIINGVESKWLNIYNDYIMTYYTFTAKQVRTNLGIASGAAYYDENGNEISGELVFGDYTNIKASVGDKLYLSLTQRPNEGYEFVCWTVNVGDVVVQKDDNGYYIIVNGNTTIISPTFKKIQCNVKVDILGKTTEQIIEYGTSFNLVTDETLSDGKVFSGWIYEDEDGKDYLWDHDTNITIDHSCTIKAYYGIPVTPEFYIQMPIVGENPTYEVHEKYAGTLGKDPYNNDGLGITWYLYDLNYDSYTELDKDYVFEEDALYNITLCLNLTTSGYAWAKDDEGYLVYPKLNGNSIDYDDYEGVYEWFSVTYSLYTERYDVTVTNGTVLVNTFSANKAGQYDVITATANEAEVGKVFDKWIVTGIDTSSLDLTKTELTFTMPANAVTVEATYKNVDYTITVTNGIVNKQTAIFGDKVTVTANKPESHKAFDKWIVRGFDSTETYFYDEQLEFTMPAGDVTIEACYKDVGGCRGDIATPLFSLLFIAGAVFLKRKRK